LEIQSDSEEIITYFTKSYRYFLVYERERTAPVIISIDTAAFGGLGEITVIKGNKNKKYCNPYKGHLLSYAQTIFSEIIFSYTRSHFLIHAGSVSRNGSGVLLMGTSGIGKTTLTLELVKKGFHFLSDEYAPVSCDDFTVRPYPRSIGMREATLKRMGRENIAVDYIQYVLKGEKWNLEPGCFDKIRIGESCKPKLLVLLTPPSDECTHILDLTVLDKTLSPIIFEKLKGVIVAHKVFSHKGFQVLRLFLLEKYIEEVLKAIKELNGNVSFLENGVKCNFKGKPELQPMSQKEAVFEILKNMRNRYSNDFLEYQFEGKPLSLAMKVADFAKNLECYRLTVGRLSLMVDEIYCLATTQR